MWANYHRAGPCFERGGDMSKLIFEVALGLVLGTVAVGVIILIVDRWLGWRHRRKSRHRLE